MKMILIGINATYNHLNLAIRSIAKYIDEEIAKLKINKSSILIQTKEYTINDSIKDNVHDLLNEDASIYGFSAYIWNISIILEMCEILKKLKPDCTIIIGGPEVSFEKETFFEFNPQIDYIIQGPGEKACLDFVIDIYNKKHTKTQNSDLSNNETCENTNCDLSNNKLDESANCDLSNNETCENTNCDLSSKEISESTNYDLSKSKTDTRIIKGEIIQLEKLPFAYGFDNIDDKTKHIYYETTRGCPYNCSYCLSSTIKSMSVLPLDRVKKEMEIFITQNTRQIKLVDRTFNFDDKRAIEIWEFLIEKYSENQFNTNFHFEIAADLLTDKSLEVLSRAPKGLFQFEIGVQSTNEIVLSNINRKFNLEKLYENVRKLKSFGNINLHLDLIAGLPGEDMKSFSKSFHDVLSLSPDMLQLGFLKVLKGSPMREESSSKGLIYSDKPPYEILETPDMSFSDLLSLKRIEKILDRYYNSTLFPYSMKYILNQFENSFEFFEIMQIYWNERGNFNRNLSRQEIIRELFTFGIYQFNKTNPGREQEMMEIFRDLLKFDYYFYDKKGNIPELLFNFSNHHPMLNRNQEKDSWYKSNGQPVCKKPRIEMYSFDVLELLSSGNIIYKKSFVLYEMYEEMPVLFDVMVVENFD